MDPRSNGVLGGELTDLSQSVEALQSKTQQLLNDYTNANKRLEALMREYGGLMKAYEAIVKDRSSKSDEDEMLKLEELKAGLDFLRTELVPTHGRFFFLFFFFFGSVFCFVVFSYFLYLLFAVAVRSNQLCVVITALLLFL